MADTTNRLAGAAYITVDGLTLMVAGDVKYKPSGVVRSSLIGMDGVHGYSEKPTAGMISISVRDSGGTKIEDFNNMTNVTVTAELANGKTVIGTGMWVVEEQEVSVEEATFTLKFEGASVKEY